MLKVACTACGARYQVAELSVGRSAHCKKCRATFVIAAIPAAPPPAAAAEDDIFRFEGLDRGAPVDRPLNEAIPIDGPADAVAVPVAQMEYAAYDDGYGAGSAIAPIPGYLAAVARSALFVRSLSNVIIFAIACGAVGLQLFFALAMSFGSCFVFAALVIVSGWYMSFLLRTVHNASANEDDLPELTLSGGMLDDVILPMLGSLLSWLTAAIPFIVCAVYLFALDKLSAGDLIFQLLVSVGMQGHGFAFEPTVGGGPLLGSMMVVSLFLWPMFLLVVAVGGLPCLIRVDLISIAIVRSFPGYLVMSVISVGLLLASTFLAGVIFPEWDPATDAYPEMGRIVAVAVLNTFLSVMSMRAIGLYYHHFKHRLAWDWG